MANEKSGLSKQNKPMHYSVGAVIKKGDKYLLIDRKNPPFGYAGIAGHIDEEEDDVEALIREVKEESGLKITCCTLIFEEELDFDWCNRGIGVHYWFLFECVTDGKEKMQPSECKSIGWYTKEEISKLNLQKVWEYWFKKLKII